MIEPLLLQMGVIYENYSYIHDASNPLNALLLEMGKKAVAGMKEFYSPEHVIGCSYDLACAVYNTPGYERRDLCQTMEKYMYGYIGKMRSMIRIYETFLWGVYAIFYLQEQKSPQMKIFLSLYKRMLLRRHKDHHFPHKELSFVKDFPAIIESCPARVNTNFYPTLTISKNIDVTDIWQQVNEVEDLELLLCYTKSIDDQNDYLKLWTEYSKHCIETADELFFFEREDFSLEDLNELYKKEKAKVESGYFMLKRIQSMNPSTSSSSTKQEGTAENLANAIVNCVADYLSDIDHVSESKMNDGRQLMERIVKKVMPGYVDQDTCGKLLLRFSDIAERREAAEKERRKRQTAPVQPSVNNYTFNGSSTIVEEASAVTIPSSTQLLLNNKTHREE